MVFEVPPRQEAQVSFATEEGSRMCSAHRARLTTQTRHAAPRLDQPEMRTTCGHRPASEYRGGPIYGKRIDWTGDHACGLHANLTRDIGSK